MLVLPLFWMHFVLAHAICVSCALFLHKYYRKKKYIYTTYMRRIDGLPNVQPRVKNVVEYIMLVGLKGGGGGASIGRVRV